MTPSSLLSEPPCPAPRGTQPAQSTSAAPGRVALHAERRDVRDIPREAWDRLAAQNPWATPFSGWSFQRAWWDAYGDNAHDETLVICADRPGGEPMAIVPLMHRRVAEPAATAVFFGASYHADYATILGAPADFPAIATALVDRFADARDGLRWDAIDLRRLRCGDPAADAVAAAFGAREIAEGWTLNVEREDVCPVVHLPADASLDDYLASLGKKERHEIRRKVRRAGAVGQIRLDDASDPVIDLDAFIDLHQEKWGAAGLFPDTPGGAQSRVFFRRMFELAGAAGPRLTFLSVGGRRIAAGIHFETADGYLYYNAGVDPAARELSPGVLMIYAYMKRALVAGVRRVDFLRGSEPYKYEWGAEDEPIQRVLVRRRNG